MLEKIVYGQPVATDAVIQPVPDRKAPPEYLTIASKDEGFITISCKLAQNDIVYGLGEAVGGINKRGHLYESFNSDDPNHTEEKSSLYGSHNLVVVSGAHPFGLFIDCGAAVTFDIGYTESDTMTITPSVPDFILYTISGKNAEDIIRQFRKAIGQSYIAPFWAFGFQQSRWSYYTADDVRELVRSYRSQSLPLDAVYLDIDYMEAYKDFTISEERFPDFEQFVQEMRTQGIRLVPIIDAGVKIEKGYNVYEQGVQNNYFCKRADGTDFVAGVWPGRTHFPDFMQPEARSWFGQHYKLLLDKGIEGFWNDMNEPAMFFTEEGIQEAKSYLKDFDFSSNDSNQFFTLSGRVGGLANRQEDYAAFYHNINGRMVCHNKVHNLYGYNMTRAAAEAFETLRKDQRILLFSRSSYIGMHRYGGLWTGDNQSWWSHLLLNIRMMPSLNMCGFLYSGADLGGFGCHCTRDLLLRWLAFGLFTPLMRNHSAYGTRRQECTAFGDTTAFQGLLKLRYRLIPYLYSEYMKACLNGEMLFRPLAFDYPQDEIACHTEDQLLVGESIMIAPIYVQNAIGRTVYLPEDMELVVFRNAVPVRRVILPKGVHFVHAALDEVPIFLRRNRLLPLFSPAQCTDELRLDKPELFSYHDQPVSYTLYHDDGISKNYNQPEHFTTLSLTN